MGASPSIRQAAITNTKWTSRFHRISLALAAPHPWFWTATLAIVAADALWLALLGISLQPLGFLLVAATVAILLAAAALWALARPEATLRAMALSTAGLLGFTIAIALLHYLAVTLNRPFVDKEIAAVEAALGFDWRAHSAWLEEHPALARGLALAYHSSGPQIALVVIVLSALRRLGRLWRFVRLFAVTLLVVIAVAILFPAEGPYAFYMNVESGTSGLETMGATWHLEPVSRLRSGGIDSLALLDLRGLATFPSFHVCLALITAWALAPVPILGPLAVLLNAAVIVATLGAGGHYLPDVLAGGFLGGLALAYPSLRAALRARQPRQATSLRESEAASHSAAMIPVTVRARSITRPG